MNYYNDPFVPNIPEGYAIVGTCSLCGGPVIIPICWWSVVPPTPTCAHCGAFKQEASYGPKIRMAPRGKTWLTTDSGTRLERDRNYDYY